LAGRPIFAGRATAELHIDCVSEAVGAERMLALQVQANFVDFGLAGSFRHELAVSGASLFRVYSERNVTSVGTNPRIESAVLPAATRSVGK
jgi:hypothetical protein